ncbi:DUF1622 domain-containing protein [Diaminobutyricibacter tongyongensis]|uniref:DUF1622 domain-containing protein n=1 Tax=Leifsonia tongyongensis TaxID=1268043 RepID=A0A6L9Y2G3_9MICO|nr:DUF1622 domain-containing protein [Diaminobutyricibacter tongyongensis]NEN07464.1 DUF1622 domain-containing protein [Diaminobutyricibacter tongyongensis]
MQDFFETVTNVFEFVGVATMVLGFVVVAGIAIRVWVRSRDGGVAFRTLRQSIGGVILLGLEILVAADLVKTVTSPPSLTDAVVLAVIVLIRTVLSFSLQVEIDGVAPWRRAFVTGPEVIAHAARRADGSVEGSSGV